MWNYINKIYSRRWFPADDRPEDSKSPMNKHLTQLGSTEHLSMKLRTIVGMIEDETNSYFSPREETRINVKDASLVTGGTMKNLEESHRWKKLSWILCTSTTWNLLLFFYEEKCHFVLYLFDLLFFHQDVFYMF